MSNEPENRVTDSRVTETYRELASEQAPRHLNERVLKMAAHSRTPYGRARAWMRPAAWAATIGLSFAIVLELTRLPALDSEPPAVAPASDSSTSADRQGPLDDAALPVRTLTPEAPAAAAVEKARAPVDAEQKRATDSLESAQMPSKDELAARATAVMQGAADMARAQTGSDNRADVISAERESADAQIEMAEQMLAEPARTRLEEADRLAARKVSQEASGAAALLADTGNAAAADNACPASQREAPDTWLDCIRDLRERGLEEQADEEYAEFQRLFPEFDDSITDK